MPSNRSGVTLISTERSATALAGTSTARRPMVTRPPVANALRTGSPSERRSVSSTSEATSAKRLAHHLIEALTQQGFGGVIDVIDAALPHRP